MSTLKRTTKSKFLSEDLEDFIDESKYLKEPPKPKKTPKRMQSECFEEEIPQTARKLQIKKKKVDTNEDTCREVKGKILETMEHQIDIRKQGNDNLLKSLSEVMAELREDCIALKNNQQKLQQLATALVKCIAQATTAQEQKLKALNDIHTAYKKQVEGLILRKGMKPDDRPLWFDVYKAFPPIVEPKYARPQPEIKPIRQILYKEDEIRAKFHSKGYGLAAVNMMNPGESQTKRLLQQYEKQKELGVADSEIIEKCVEVVGSERKAKLEAAAATTPQLNPRSVTSQVLSEAFKDDK